MPGDVKNLGQEYQVLVAAYVATRFAYRGVRVCREVSMGTSLLGRKRRVDILAVSDSGALALECKYQGVSGTADEKIPHALADLQSMRVPACLVYAGGGFSAGVLHLLQSSRNAAYCLPHPMLDSEREGGEFATWELDHIFATAFGWWEVFEQERKFETAANFNREQWPGFAEKAGIGDSVLSLRQGRLW